MFGEKLIYEFEWVGSYFFERMSQGQEMTEPESPVIRTPNVQLTLTLIACKLI